MKLVAAGVVLQVVLELRRAEHAPASERRHHVGACALRVGGAAVEHRVGRCIQRAVRAYIIAVQYYVYKYRNARKAARRIAEHLDALDALGIERHGVFVRHLLVVHHHRYILVLCYAHAFRNRVNHKALQAPHQLCGAHSALAQLGRDDVAVLSGLAHHRRFRHDHLVQLVRLLRGLSGFSTFRLPAPTQAAQWQKASKDTTF